VQTLLIIMLSTAADAIATLVLPVNLPDFGLDHTPFYLEMAAVEIEVRKEQSCKGRYKKTVAEMFLDITASEDLNLQGSS
jgi:hypothetical protein